MKPLVVTLLALFAAVVVTLGALQLVAWWSSHGGFGRLDTHQISDEEKLRILASLAATSSVSVDKKATILHGLSATSNGSVSEEEKLNILESLRTKP